MEYGIKGVEKKVNLNNNTIELRITAKHEIRSSKDAIDLVVFWLAKEIIEMEGDPVDLMQQAAQQFRMIQ